MSTPEQGLTQDHQELEIVNAWPVLSRNRFSHQEKLLLARLCVQHGGKFSIHGRHERFWLKIQQLFATALACPVCNLRSIMARMLAKHDSKVIQEAKESGTTQTDGDGDGCGSGTGQRGKANLKSEKEESLVATQQERLLSTMKEKRNYQAAVTALDAHYASEEEKDARDSSGRCESLKNSQDEERSQACGKDVVFTGSRSWAIVKEEKIESIRDKRGKIKERGELLDASLAEESSRLTAVLERIASALVPTCSSSDLTKQSSPDAVPMITKPDMTETRFKSLKSQLDIAEEALEEVKGNTVEILKILQQK
ncbi:hypothetical protein HOY80DRAFT_1058782 [Tuber brumale]|nr:hypothetical protein HOY80DRAFT_1058782 [Tuber brumale]